MKTCVTMEVLIGPFDTPQRNDNKDPDSMSSLMYAIADIVFAWKMPEGADPYVSGAFAAPTPDWMIDE